MDEPIDDRPDEDLPDDDDDDIPYRTMDGSNIPSTSSSTPMKTSSGTLESVEGANKDLMIEQLYKKLGVEGNVNRSIRDRFRVTKNSKTGRTMLQFLRKKNGVDWVNLTKDDGQFRAVKAIEVKMGGLETLKGMLGLGFNETPPLLERSRQAAKKLNDAIPTDLEMDNISLVDLNERIRDVDESLQEA